jgi:hypothetical protein
MPQFFFVLAIFKHPVFEYIFFLNLEVIQLNFFKDLAHISLPANGDYLFRRCR